LARFSFRLGPHFPSSPNVLQVYTLIRAGSSPVRQLKVILHTLLCFSHPIRLAVSTVPGRPQAILFFCRRTPAPTFSPYFSGTALGPGTPTTFFGPFFSFSFPSSFLPTCPGKRHSLSHLLALAPSFLSPLFSILEVRMGPCDTLQGTGNAPPFLCGPSFFCAFPLPKAQPSLLILQLLDRNQSLFFPHRLRWSWPSFPSLFTCPRCRQKAPFQTPPTPQPPVSL